MNDDYYEMTTVLHEQLRSIDIQILRASEEEREILKERSFAVKEELKALERQQWPRGYLK